VVAAVRTQGQAGRAGQEETGAVVMRFADLARRLAAAAGAAGLVVPAFRSPPRLAGARRTIRRCTGGPIVAVHLRGRRLADVAADMVEGVVVANGLTGESAVRVRTALAQAIAAPAPPAAA
jgi:hypothetical protein